MSTGHANVTWQSPDGTWSRGFYLAERWYPDDDSEPEIDYRSDEFEWVSTGHPTEDAANDSWRGANPGHSNSVPLPATAEEHDYWGDSAERLDDLAAQLWASPYRTYMCQGTPKRRVPRFLAREIAAATADASYHRIEGYANLPIDVSAQTAELRSRIPELTTAERAAVSAELTKAIERIDTQMEPSTSWRSRPRPADAVDFAVKLRESLRAFEREVTTPRGRPDASTSRAKTTTKSTTGSFAPKGHSAPDIRLG